jgi:riboflavin biosynthesis pyrimidine reductase
VSAAVFRRLMPEAGGTATAAQLAGELDLRGSAPPDRPAVALNMIASLDGRITVAGRAGPLANRADYELFHALRGAGDAVLVGAGTVRAEGYGAMDRPCVVVSRSLDLPPALGLLRAPGNRVIVITDREDEVQPCAATVEYLRQPPGEIDMAAALRRLRAEHDIRALICEGGPHLNAALLAGRLVDELFLVTAPLLVGGELPLTLVVGPALDPPAAATLASLCESGDYLFARYSLT